MKKIYIPILLLFIINIPSGVGLENINLKGMVYDLVGELQLARAKTLSLQEQTESLKNQKETAEIEAAKALSVADKEATSLKEELAELSREKEKETASKEALKREIAARNSEQTETRQLLKDILQQQIPPEPLPSETDTTSTKPSKTEETSLLSPYQKQLLSRRNQHQIGDAAWAALGGKNTKLARALATAIQESFCVYLANEVDMFTSERNNFKLKINKKEQQFPYKY